MVDSKRLFVGYVLPVLAGLVGFFVGENPAFSIIGLLFVYVLWLVILELLGEWSRFASGLAIVVLSVPLFFIGLIATWVGAAGLVVFAHGNYRAFTGAARLDL